jgi:signal transduction histidine kinase
MEIADDGIGLSPDTRSKAGAFGLIGIEERIHGLGGTFDTASTPGGGMTIMLSIPISCHKSEPIHRLLKYQAHRY